MCHRLDWFMHLQAQGLSKGDEHSSVLIGYGTPTDLALSEVISAFSGLVTHRLCSVFTVVSCSCHFIVVHVSLTVFCVDMGLVCRHVELMQNTWVAVFGCRQCRELAQTSTCDCGILTGNWKAFVSS